MRYKNLLMLLLFTSSISIADDMLDNLPEMGDSATQVLSMEEEQRYGDYIIREIRRQLPLITDPLINYYIDNLGFRLVSKIPQTQPRKFEFFVVSDPEINAFALPGGYVGIHTGLLAKTENESELASVLGHELAHVLQRHIARRIEQNSQMSLPSIAAMTASLLLTVINPELGLAGLYSSQAAQQQFMLNFSRKNESEADRIGIQTLANAQLDPNAMASFFDKLMSANQFRKEPLAFLSTHPLTQDRIADARNRAKATPLDKIFENKDYYYARARALRLASKNKQTLLQQYEDLLKKNPDSEFLHYGYVLSLIDTEQYEQAQPIISMLINNNPHDIFHQLLQTELWMAQQKYAEALQHTDALLDQYPRNLPISLYKAELLVKLTQYAQAKQLLLPLSHEYPSNRLIFELLIEAHAKSGDQVAAHETQSQLLFITGNYDKALIQLELALAFPNIDLLSKARINARMNQVKQVILELKQ